MIISLCVPSMNRTHDLKVALPAMIKAAQASPPCEISLVNYNSTDDLDEWIRTVEIPDDVIFSYRKYSGRDYYHMAHARNLSVVNSKGDYIAIGSADMVPAEDYFKIAREMIETDHYTWIQDKVLQGFIICQRKEFIAAGGYDENFEFYGPEDRDLALRLHRRAGKYGYLPRRHVGVIRTSKHDKHLNYRTDATEVERRNSSWYQVENNAINFRLEVNRGRPWGQWT